MSEIHTSRVGGDPDCVFDSHNCRNTVTFLRTITDNVIFANTPNRFCDRKPFFYTNLN